MKITWHSLVPLNLLIGEQKSFKKFLRDVLENENPFSSGNFINYCTFFPHSQFFMNHSYQGPSVLILKSDKLAV